MTTESFERFVPTPAEADALSKALHFRIPQLQAAKSASPEVAAYAEAQIQALLSFAERAHLP